MAGWLRQRALRFLLNEEPTTISSDQRPTRGDPAEPSPGPLVHLYTVLADVLRDQVSDQLSSASTNDLVAAGLLAANLAVAVGVLILRGTVPYLLDGWWWYRWWYPLPFFGVSSLMVGVALLPPLGRRKFQDGPKIPVFMRAMADASLEHQMEGLLRSLQLTWNNNDALLRTERHWFNAGLLVLAIGSLAAIAMYTWALT